VNKALWIDDQEQSELVAADGGSRDSPWQMIEDIYLHGNKIRNISEYPHLFYATVGWARNCGRTTIPDIISTCSTATSEAFNLCGR